MTIKERANNKIYAKVIHAGIDLEDLRRELKSGIFRGNITREEMNGLIEGAQTELKVLNYIYKLIETNDD
tara:strand:- start:1957 stop:2166 length:210 start_codon:yes stop_codon:yes gene_type:complete